MIRRLALWTATLALRGQRLQIIERGMPIFHGTIEHVEERRDMRERIWLYAVARSHQGDVRGVPAVYLTRCRHRKAWIFGQ